MASQSFPTGEFCSSIVKFLDSLKYDDNNLSLGDRLERLRYVYAGTAAYFREPLPHDTLKSINPRRIEAVTYTISHFIVFCWSRVPKEVQVDISIYLSIINVLDDEIDADPSSHLESFWEDLLQGRKQKHPYWLLTNAHLPKLLRHYGTFCSWNIMRCTFDYFEGCWIEQHNFQGYRGSDSYPAFMRRLNCLGGAVAGTIFPAAEFDDQKLFKELSCIMAEIDGPVALVNDLFSYYKEYDLDEANLVSNWCTTDGITKTRALERLTEQCTQACTRILDIFKDKDPRVLDTLRCFIHGYVTWHICDLRYRLREVYDSACGHDGEKFRAYYEKALGTGWIEPKEWCVTPGEVQSRGLGNGYGGHGSMVNGYDAPASPSRGILAPLMSRFSWKAPSAGCV